MKAGRLAFIVIAGFLAGLGGHIAVDRLTFDRADRIADVFQALCLGANDTDSGALGLHPRLGYAGEWVDTRSRTLIVHNGSGCSVNAFDAHNLSSSEVGALVTRIERVVARDFPALTLEPDTNPDDATLERFWMNGDFRAPDRWGIILYAFLPTSPDGSTMLRYAPPLRDAKVVELKCHTDPSYR